MEEEDDDEEEEEEEEEEEDIDDDDDEDDGDDEYDEYDEFNREEDVEGDDRFSSRAAESTRSATLTTAPPAVPHAEKKVNRVWRAGATNGVGRGPE